MWDNFVAGFQDLFSFGSDFGNVAPEPSGIGTLYTGASNAVESAASEVGNVVSGAYSDVKGVFVFAALAVIAFIVFEAKR